MSKDRDIRSIVGNNIMNLRTASGMTQQVLAEQINYSDKAISKWERGEALPDISVLLKIAEIFGVPLDYLTVLHDKIEYQPIGAIKKTHLQAKAVITVMSLMVVWLLATFIFVIVHIAYRNVRFEWLAFIYAIPVSVIVWLVLNSIWFNKRRNYLIITLLMWSVLFTAVITFLPLGYNVSILLLLGIPGQIIILLWSSLGYIIRKDKK